MSFGFLAHKGFLYYLAFQPFHIKRTW